MSGGSGAVVLAGPSPSKKRKETIIISETAAAPPPPQPKDEKQMLEDKYDFETLKELTKIPCCFGRQFNTPENSPTTDCLLASNLDRFKEQKTIHYTLCRGIVVYLCDMDKRRTRGICAGCGRCISTRVDDPFVKLKCVEKEAFANVPKSDSQVLICATCQSLPGPVDGKPLSDTDDKDVQIAWVKHHHQTTFVKPKNERAVALRTMNDKIAAILTLAKNMTSAEKIQLAAQFREIGFRKKPEAINQFSSLLDPATTPADKLHARAIDLSRSPDFLNTNLSLTETRF